MVAVADSVAGERAMRARVHSLTLVLLRVDAGSVGRGGLGRVMMVLLVASVITGT